jgi:HD-GYP domain-containing protein (c-di-GMP phosphodiesterase class II)
MLQTSDQVERELLELTRDSINEKQDDPLTTDLEDLSKYVSDLLAAIPNPVYVVNPLGIIIDGNQALEQLTGRPLEQILGEKQSFLFGNEAPAKEIDEQIRETGRLEGKEIELLTLNKTKVPVCVFSKSRQDNLGNVSHVVALVDNSRNRQIELELERAFFELAETISRALGCRDPYTEDHGRKVAKLCRLTGEKLGLTEKQLQGLYVGGLLHDVGKIAIPEIILAKPGRLTEEEYNLIRSHTKHGYSILKDTTMPWPIAEIAFSHHERLDGSGYPLGINANELSLEIRIVGVCDVVEAMSSHRPYRPRRTERQVIKELQNGRCKRYDRDVVDAVLEVINIGAFRLR